MLIVLRPSGIWVRRQWIQSYSYRNLIFSVSSFLMIYRPKYVDQCLGLMARFVPILYVLLSCVSSSRSDSGSISPQRSLFGLHIVFSSFCRICSIPDCCWYSLHFSWSYRCDQWSLRLFSQSCLGWGNTYSLGSHNPSF